MTRAFVIWRREAEHEIPTSTIAAEMLAICRLHAAFASATGNSHVPTGHAFFYMSTLRHPSLISQFRVHHLRYGSPFEVAVACGAATGTFAGFLHVCLQILKVFEERGVVDQRFLSDILSQVRDLALLDVTKLRELSPRIHAILSTLRTPQRTRRWIVLEDEGGIPLVTEAEFLSGFNPDSVRSSIEQADRNGNRGLRPHGT